MHCTTPGYPKGSKRQGIKGVEKVKEKIHCRDQEALAAKVVSGEKRAYQSRGLFGLVLRVFYFMGK